MCVRGHERARVVRVIHPTTDLGERIFLRDLTPTRDDAVEKRSASGLNERRGRGGLRVRDDAGSRCPDNPHTFASMSSSCMHRLNAERGLTRREC